MLVFDGMAHMLFLTLHSMWKLPQAVVP
jgi:hypothetical protein